ncbi:MAG: hypothetical protein KBC38_01845 [Candidatus Pacebacteria bacterium]|nr:hypothetical protein [Candidatus Paceibacterota bacterium]MBP9840036.1 hypothetical protein [Candidatus Paceibacterota bacterium]
MERIDNSLRKYFPPVKLYIEDLIEIEKILKEASREVTLSDGEHKYESIEELARKRDGEILNSLKISAGSPYISLELEAYIASIYSASSQGIAAGIYYRTSQVLHRRLRRPSVAYSYVLIMLTNLSFVIASLFTTSALLKIGSGLSFLWILWVAYIQMFRHSTVILYEKYKQKNFFSRNKDQIILLLIGAVLSAAITIPLTHYFPQIKDFIFRQGV